MLSIALPKAPKYEEIDEQSGRFVIAGCYPGYGTTIGNSLRRTLLSSLPGTAIVAVKVKGITHEFTTLKGMKEDIVQLILNLKQVRFKLEGVDEANIVLKVKGQREVTAKDFKTTAEVKVVNPDQPIASLTSSSASLEMEVKINRGLGYVPVEQQEKGEKEIGTIAIDAIYNPVKRVNFKVENMRVGKRTDYDRIILEVMTDGSISPEEAYAQAVEVLMAQFNAVANLSEGDDDEEEREFKIKEKEERDKEKNKEEEALARKKDEITEREEDEEKSIKDIGLSNRTMNVLEANGIDKVAQLAKITEEELDEIEGMGAKGIKEVKKAIGSFGIILKSSGE